MKLENLRRKNTREQFEEASCLFKDTIAIESFTIEEKKLKDLSFHFLKILLERFSAKSLRET